MRANATRKSSRLRIATIETAQTELSDLQFGIGHDYFLPLNLETLSVWGEILDLHGSLKFKVLVLPKGIEHETAPLDGTP